MPIVINTNAAATTASFNLSKNAEALRKSLARLSSGSRITQPAEDAGGLAVAYKLDSHSRRTEAVLNNHQNALSFLQSQLNQVRLEKFNGISLFATTAGTTNSGTLNSAQNEYRYRDDQGVSIQGSYSAFSRTLKTHPSGIDTDGSISLNVTNLSFVLSLGSITVDNSASSANYNLLGLSTSNSTSATALNDNDNRPVINADGFISDITSVSISQFTQVIEKIADARSENGAEQQRIQQSYELHQTNLVNLEAAHGRIMDVDVALESTRFAKNNVLVQASASMTAQANQLTNIALTLLQ